ncbi:MAG TPA: hypothetical protein VM689_17770 [Aliidongia sp.]|nr:hypothetical protein [Aliidongia sp.]
MQIVQKEPVRLLKLADIKIEGRIDAIEEGKVYGWVWDRLRPEDRLTVEIRLGERVLATCIADQRREDLAGNGVGDGGHAFVAELAEMPAPGEIGAVVAHVTSPSSESTATLRPRLDAGVPPENILAQPITRIAELLEASLTGNRQIQLGQQALARELRTLTTQTAPDGAAAQAKAEIESTQKALGSQIEALEIFNLRLDGTLAELSTKLARLERTRAAEISLRRMVWAVGALALIAVAASAFAIVTVAV